MRFTVASVLSFAFLAAAAPQVALPSTTKDPLAGMTVAEAQNTCGKDLEVSCCNEANTSGDAVNIAHGLLAGALTDLLDLQGLGLFDQCSTVNLAIIPAHQLISSHCKQNVACCQNGNTEQNGLANIGSPCIALSSLA